MRANACTHVVPPTLQPWQTRGRFGVDGKRRVAIVVKRALGRAFATGCPQDIRKMLRIELSRMARVVASCGSLATANIALDIVAR